MLSLLGGVFQDINSWMKENLNGIGMPLLIGLLSIIGLILLSNIFVGMLKLSKPKLKIKWGQLIFLIIVVGLLIWLCLNYTNTI